MITPDEKKFIDQVEARKLVGHKASREKQTKDLVDKLDNVAQTLKPSGEVKITQLPDEVISNIADWNAAGQFIRNLNTALKGDKGDTGADSTIPGPMGKTGPRGLQGPKGADSDVPGPIGPQGEQGESGKDGKDGKDGGPDTPKEIVDKLESLKGNKRLDVQAIKGLDQLESNFYKVAKGFVPRSFTTLPDVIGHNGQTVLVNAQGTGLTFSNDVTTIEFIVDGGGSAITTGIKGDLNVGFNAIIQSWTLLADQSGSIVIDVWKDTYANFPPVVGDSITGSDIPTLSSAAKNTSTALTGWSTALSVGDILRFNVNSISTCTRVLISLKVLKGIT